MVHRSNHAHRQEIKDATGELTGHYDKAGFYRKSHKEEVQKMQAVLPITKALVKAWSYAQLTACLSLLKCYY